MGVSGTLNVDGKPTQNEQAILARRKEGNWFHAMPAIPEEIEMSEIGLSGAQKAMELLSFALGSDDDSSDADSLVGGSSPLVDLESDAQKLLKSSTRTSSSLRPPDKEKKSKVIPLHGNRTSSGNFKVTGKEPILNLNVERRSKPGRIKKLVVFLLFIAINICILTAVLALAYSLASLTAAVVVTVTCGLLWLALFIFNMWTASQTETVIYKYWKANRCRLLPLKEGKVVIITGKVSYLEETVQSDFQKEGNYLVVDTSLKSIVARYEDHCEYKDHVKQTKAVDFKITDMDTSVTILVEGSSAAQEGLLKPYLVPMVSIPLKVNADVAPLLKKKDKRRKAMQNTQYKVHEGYVVDGQTVTIMGRLKRSGANGDLVLGPIKSLHNISWFMLFHGFLPFFCPVWVSGLVIMD